MKLWLVLVLATPCAVSGGCGSRASSGTTVLAKVDFTGNPAPGAVDVHVFDPFGMIGQSHISPARLPGSITISGLPDVATELRVVAVADTSAGHLLGGTRLAVVPRQQAIANVTLSTSYSDGDRDDVPDALDGCIFVYDPMQTNTLGMGPNDACRNGDLAGAPPPPPTDMATASTASNCPSGTQSGTVFCDGFEGTDGSPPRNVWMVNAQGGTANLDTSRAYRGGSSLHLVNTGGSSASDVEVDETQSVPSHFFARAFVYVPTGFSDTKSAAIMLAEQNSGQFQGVTLNLLNRSFQTVNTVGGSGPTQGGSTILNKDQWVCLEWEVQTGASGFTRLYVDGTEDSSLNGTPTQSLNPSGGVTQFGLALVADAPAPARELWIDELAINGTGPIGCAK
jgi:hypothetical protein